MLKKTPASGGTSKNTGPGNQQRGGSAASANGPGTRKNGPAGKKPSK